MININCYSLFSVHILFNEIIMYMLFYSLIFPYTIKLF